MRSALLLASIAFVMYLDAGKASYRRLVFDAWRLVEGELGGLDIICFCLELGL